MLDSKLEILITYLSMHAIMPQNSKVRLNRTRWSRVISQKISIWRPSATLNLGISDFFGHVSVALLKICACIPNVVIFGRFAAELWSYSDFQNGGRPPCWIFEI